jgi:hypothetical protein
MGKGTGMLALIVVGIAVLVLGAWKYDTSHTDEEVVAAETLMKSDLDAQVPVTSSRERLEKFLDAHGMPGHAYITHVPPMSEFHGGSELEWATSPQYGNMMYECRLHWDFFLDDSERLIGYSDNALCKSDLTTATTDPGQPMRPGVDVAPKQGRRE